MKIDAAIDWDDPAARAALIEQVGPAEYERQQTQHRKDSVVAIVNGHAIRPTCSRFGRIFMVGETGRGWQTIAAATSNAKVMPRGSD